MTSRNHVARAVRYALALSAMTAVSASALAQQQQASEAADTTLEEVVVTGSRIVRQDFVANSPIQTVTAEQIAANADVTLDTFLNTLPQVNPAGTTTSNNPSNGGQANINLRGLGANRNLVLIDGRRAMVSASNLTVDLNTIPAAIIENIEIITGGAGAVYGADAVAGVVNLKTKTDFEGIDIRAGYSNHLELWDAREYNLSAALGGNFADGRGNAILGFEFAQRDGLIKSQRPFSAIATQTTGAIPEGVVRPNPSNNFSQAAVNQVFAQYGVAAGAVNAAVSSLGLNTDGTLFSLGTFNSPLDVQNFRYPIDLAVNTRFFPDFYSYNFDAVNILTLPNKRRSFMAKFHYELGGGVEAFALVGWTEYDSTTAIAPTPVPTGTGTENPAGVNGVVDPFRPKSNLVAANQSVPGSLVVPATNPFIPADLRTVLASRTGDDPRLVGAGAAEPFLMGTRTLPLGLRESLYNFSVTQYTLGFRGDLPVGEGWRWEFSANEGRTEEDQIQTGNVNAQNMQALLESPTGSVGGCTYNPFGRNDLSEACKSFLRAEGGISREFRQRILQGFVTGNVAELPAGDVGVVLGAEWRGFTYAFNPGAASGAIYGFNSQSPARGKNSFKDVFTELYVPILKDAPFAQVLDLTLGYRQSQADFRDLRRNTAGDNTSDSYKVELSWQPLDYLRGRASYQRAVRSPNFGELFDGNTSAPQYFDPCSSESAIRRGANAAQVQALCVATGVGAAAYPNFAATPGGQITTQVTGNTELNPEKADTITFGVVFNSPWGGALERLTASLDYYSIEIDGAILTPDPNLFVADCYNYFGNNPTYSATYAACQQVIRSANNISRINGAPGVVPFPGVNATTIATDGIDLQVDYGIGMPALFGQESDLRLNLLVNYLLSFERQDRPSVPKIDYAGSVSYFGQDLGTSFPELKANLTAGYRVGPVSADVRLRFIDSMVNRASLQFAGQPTFTGVPSMTYVDLGLTWRFMEGASIRVGINNLTDKEPPLYSPNVQSGTDPSLYDVIGRRIFGQVNFKF
ncbi:MAG: TonB-dependent receptor domain-containing protein [Pseudomonadota bacterium]